VAALTSRAREYLSGVARLLVPAVAAAVLALPGASAGAPGQPTGYDGHIPFECELQQAGVGTEFAHPDADPFCVEYDKTHQNVTELGVVQFLSQEPARFAAAGPKCWYFQRDHWTGSVVQDDGTTQTYHWDGSYYFDKARGLGGVHVENFTVNGQTGDPRDMPGFPEDWKPYFGPGRGGVQTSDTVRADPRCVAKAKKAPAPGPYRCSDAGGAVRAGIGPLRLGMARRDAAAALGPPARTTGRVDRWCTGDGGKLQGGFSSKDRLVFALTTSAAFRARSVSVGDRSAAVRRKTSAKKVLQRGGVAVYAGRSPRRLLVFGLDRRRVRFIAVAGPRASRRAIDRWLDASR
jgi:hypothetical protein